MSLCQLDGRRGIFRVFRGFRGNEFGLNRRLAELERELGRELLAGVSRSFYLSLRVLPKAIRGAVSLSYLLARASDTIADATCVSGEARLDYLERFRRVLVDGAEDAGLFAELSEDLAAKHDHPMECELLRKLRLCVEWLEAMPAREQGTIRRVQEPIIRGQRLDIERFEMGDGVRALRTAVELDEYTYLVAGAVGEFWTEISMDNLPGYTDRSREEMVALGIRYGKGLQLVNILRDVAKDLKNGRCYLPLEELGEDGILPEAIMRVSGKWQGICAEHLECGREYVNAVRNWRSRFATELPFVLALGTNERVAKASWEDLEAGVKVSRKDVKRAMVGGIWRMVFKQKI
jgi:farnesyl-diphosphate farnesyltransferase